MIPSGVPRGFETASIGQPQIGHYQECQRSSDRCQVYNRSRNRIPTLATRVRQEACTASQSPKVIGNCLVYRVANDRAVFSKLIAGPPCSPPTGVGTR